ncbi:MAG: ankyrin repeat domain-containing protein [Candidatus Babeliales bacterium]
MKIKFLFLLIYPIIFLSYLNIFAIKKSDAAMLYKATLEDCFDKTQEHLKKLIRIGTDIDSEETVQEELIGFTALHMASYYGLYSGIPKILAMGANINKPVGLLNNLSGMTALQLAIIRNLPKIVYVLLQNQARIDMPPSIPWFSTSLCFDFFVETVCLNFSKEPPSELKNQLIGIAQKEVIDMAKILVRAGLKFDEDTKYHVLRKLDLNLDNLPS